MLVFHSCVSFRSLCCIHSVIAMLIPEDPLMNLHSQLSFSLLWIVLVSSISFTTSLFTFKSPLNGTNADTEPLWDVAIGFPPVWKLLTCPLLDPFQQRCDTAAVLAQRQPAAGAAAGSQHSRHGLRIQAKMQVFNTLKSTLLLYETIGHAYFAGKGLGIW